MAWYDSLLAGWQMRCPEAQQPALLSLAGFRRIERFPGPARPAAFRVTYDCPLCEGSHQALIAQPELDLAPLTGPLAPHYDLMSGRMDWAAEGVTHLWSHSLRQGRWPLVFRCSQEPVPVAGWPSLLTAIEPDERAHNYMVHYRCPHCERPGCEQWSAQRLVLAPLSGF